MEKNIKDYIQYYIGCRCLNTWFTPEHEMYDNGWVLSGILPASVKPYQLLNSNEVTWTDSIKPILRKLESITKEEMKEFILMEFMIENTLKDVGFNAGSILFANSGFLSGGECRVMEGSSTKQFHYLLKQGFDLFSLCDSGLAIDVSTLAK